MKWLLAITLFSISILNSNSQNYKWECNNALTQFEMNHCVSEELQKADSIMLFILESLNRYIDRQINSIDKSDNLYNWYLDLKNNINESQLSWENTRDLNAQFYNIKYDGGSMKNMVVASSKINDTYKRIEVLNECLKSFK